MDLSLNHNQREAHQKRLPLSLIGSPAVIESDGVVLRISQEITGGTEMAHSEMTAGDGASLIVCEELETNPGEYRDQYVGIVRGAVIAANEDFFRVIELLCEVEPDHNQHFVVRAGQPQSREIFNFGLAR
jgi:hypothetical protein